MEVAVRSTLPLLLTLVLVTAGCSESMLSPSPIEDGDGAPAAPKLRWDRVAPGCSPRTPPSPIPDVASARVTHEADGSITVSWLNYPFPQGGTGLLYARFVQSGAEWALCFWDTAGV
jgi:hypothetical protein